MMGQYNMGFLGWGMSLPGWFYPFMGVVALWSLLWKGLALWHSSRRNDPWWFVALLVINTVGILEIVYLFVILKLKFEDLFSKK